MEVDGGSLGEAEHAHTGMASGEIETNRNLTSQLLAQQEVILCTSAFIQHKYDVPSTSATCR